MGPRTAASATASQWPPERGSRARMGVAAGQCGVGRRGVALGTVGGHSGPPAAAPRRSTTRPDGVAPSSGSAGRTISCSASSALSNQRPSRSGSAKWSSATSSSAGGRVQPRRVARQLIQRQQPGGQRRVVLEDRRAVADPAAEAGPSQPAVDDMQIDDRRVRIVLRRRGIRADRARRSASASAVIASPFHAVTTLSSRPGCGRVEPGGQQRRADPLEPLGIVGVGQAAAAPSCRVRMCRRRSR